ncbi:acyl-coenzyme A thioesterase 9, mitochondrial-like [Sycon ciliatum]|uniref:acyl-coenzyme A thioesterase 9, mitochondrial-like n=1 Tax=Sycon ciliatum TaxID=27933 RepID=UPI0020ACE2BF|eukprot:scpid54518/ scgid20253/ Acyl-coenzyme A thioesterase 9, mitochondrial; Acyl-CoA thioester hydrolase 9
MWCRSTSRLSLCAMVRTCSSTSPSACSQQAQTWTRMAGGSDIKEIREHMWNSFLGVDHQLPWRKERWTAVTAEKREATACGAPFEPDIAPHSVEDSKVVGYIPLGTSAERRIAYMNIMGGVRAGLLLEDMDIIAAYSAYMHCSQHGNLDKAKNLSIVTALVDRLDIRENISLERDIRLTGMVTWVGKSSMEVAVFIDQEEKGPEETAAKENTAASQDGDSSNDNRQWKRLAEATLVMVGRNPQTGKAAQINFLQLRTQEEIEMFQQGERRKAGRQMMAKASLTRRPPSEDERRAVHELFLETVDSSSAALQDDPRLPEGSVWMSDTRMSSVRLCHPQHRNMHNKIFGGYLMRQAFELAWASVSVYTQTLPQFIAMDDIFFRVPVEIGDMLEFKSQIVFTEGPYLHVSVHAEKIACGDGARQTTNIFQFTFASQEKKPRRVLPKTYSDAMRYIHGKRCYDKTMNRFNGYSAS